MRARRALAIALLGLFSWHVQAEIIEWEKLVPFLPAAFNGIAATSKATGYTLKKSSGDVTAVEQRYGTGREKCSILIHSGSTASAVWATTQNAGKYGVNTSTQMMKKAELLGFNGFQNYRYKNRQATVWLSLAPDLLLIATIEGVDSVQPVIDTLTGMKLKELAALAKPVGK